jgi:hypothetical protein
MRQVIHTAFEEADDGLGAFRWPGLTRCQHQRVKELHDFPSAVSIRSLNSNGSASVPEAISVAERLPQGVKRTGLLVQLCTVVLVGSHSPCEGLLGVAKRTRPLGGFMRNADATGQGAADVLYSGR